MQMQNRLSSRFSGLRVAAGRGSAALLAASLGLAACGDDTVQTRTFSGGGAPAEVRVTSRPPLSLPPDFTRRPEREPDRAPEMARPAETGAPGPGAGNLSAPPSTGQSALLSAAGPAAPADIRVRVNEDAQVEMTDRALTDELMRWQRPADQPRMIDNKSSKGLLSRIF